MKVVVTGGTGFIGRALTGALLARGDSVVVFTRDASQAGNTFQGVVGASTNLVLANWEPTHEGAWQSHLAGADAVVHLAGETLVGRRQSKALMDKAHASRVRTAELLVDGMRKSSTPPRVFLSGSAVGYYGDRGADVLDESAAPGADPLAHLCVDWEKAALGAQVLGVRVVNTRMGIVLGPGGGALEIMALPFRLFVGGAMGSGQQYVSWVQLDDAAQALLYCIDQDGISGPVDVTAPEPVTNERLSTAIARALNRPSWLKVPSFALRAALGGGAEPILGGQRVLPKRLEESGFRFRHPRVEEAVALSLG